MNNHRKMGHIMPVVSCCLWAFGIDTQGQADCREPQYGWTNTTTFLPNGLAIDAMGRVHVSRWGSTSVTTFDSFGAALNSFTYSSNDISVQGISADTLGNIYLFGTVRNGADFDPGPGMGNLFIGFGIFPFVVKLGGDYAFHWARSLDPLLSIRALECDAAGNVFVAGDYYYLNPPTDLFIQKFSSQGDPLWSHVMGGTEGRVNAVDVTSSGDVYLGGYFEGTVDFDPSSGNEDRTAQGTSDGFVLKLSSVGQFIWVYTFGNSSIQREYVAGLAALESVGLLIIAEAGNQVDYNPEAEQALFDGSTLTKLSNDGNWQWTSAQGLSLQAVQFDQQGDIIVAERTYGGFPDACLTKRNPAGLIMWSHCQVGTGASQINELSIDSMNHIYVTGNFEYDCDFDITEGEDIRQAQNHPWDGFLTKMLAISLPPTLDSPTTPNGMIDAREDFSEFGVQRGISQIFVDFSCEVLDNVTGGALSVASFLLVDTTPTPPSIASVSSIDLQAATFDIQLSAPLNALAWTMLVAYVRNLDGTPIDFGTGDRIDIIWLPGDVNGNGVSDTDDLTALKDHLQAGATGLLAEWSADIDWSGTATAADLVRLVDLMNGTNTSQPWLGVVFP